MQLNGARYRYDGAGNLIERQQPNGERLTLGYDGANRLVHLIHASELGATREATYRYDGLGRRISKTVHHTNGTTATTHYGWDGDRIVREETDNQRTTVVYEPGSFVPMLRIDDTQQGQILSAYITDALGTPMQLVTPNGQPRWLAEPDDWAAVKNQRAVRNVSQPIRFQGQWHDEESGLYYNRHRYYDPQQGRYISQDPIGLKGGTNLYGYVTNPTGMVDPLGLTGAAAARSAAGGAAALGGRVAIPAWATNPLGVIVWGMWPTPMGDATTEGAGYTGTVFAPTDRQSSPGTPINRPGRPDTPTDRQSRTSTPTDRTGRYDTPIVDQHGWNTELPSLQPGGCRSEQPIDGLSSCPSELPIFDQSGWASELPIASPLPGDNTTGGGYQPAGTDMIGGAVYSEGSNVDPNNTTRVIENLITHQTGNQQVIVDGQHWNLPRGMTPNDIPLSDSVGDTLQTITSDAAERWNPRRNLSVNEQEAIADARADGEFWRANLLEKQAKGRWVESQVRASAEAANIDLQWSRRGVDVVDPNTGLKYDILSGTKSNADTHAKRMHDQLFRMIKF